MHNLKQKYLEIRFSGVSKIHKISNLDRTNLNILEINHLFYAVLVYGNNQFHFIRNDACIEILPTICHTTYNF